MNRKVISFELDLDFILIAITSCLKDYKLCFHINKELNTDFRKADDYNLYLQAGNEPLQFSQYFFKIQASETEFYILSNHNTAGFLIPEMENVDYFMLIKNHFDKEELEVMVSRLKRIAQVTAVAQVNPKLIRSNENLLF